MTNTPINLNTLIYDALKIIILALIEMATKNAKRMGDRMLKTVVIIALLVTFSHKINAQQSKLDIKFETSVSDMSLPKLDKNTTITVNIKDATGHPMLGYIRLLDARKRPILNYNSDDKGYAYLILYDLTYIKYIVVDYLGYYGVEIPLSKISNKRSNITVHLTGQQLED